MVLGPVVRRPLVARFGYDDEADCLTEGIAGVACQALRALQSAACFGAGRERHDGFRYDFLALATCGQPAS